MPFLKMAFRALAVGQNTYVRMNADGLLCVQHKIENTEYGSECVLTFIVLPFQDDDDDISTTSS